jgi:hypothetical protein
MLSSGRDSNGAVIISQMPTFLAFKNGQKIGELVGASPPGLQVCAIALYFDYRCLLTGTIDQKLIQDSLQL